MAVRRVPAKKRRRHAGHQTAVGLHSQNGRGIAQNVTERHVSVRGLAACPKSAVR